MTKSAIMLSRLLTAVILIGAIFGLPQDVSSQTSTVIRFPNYYALSCQSSWISVRVENVTDLTAYHLEIDFTPGDVAVLDVQNGNFLPEGIYEPTNGYDNDAGTIIFGMTRTDYTTQPVDGSGVLINILIQAVNIDQDVNFTVRPYVPGTEPTNGTGSVLVGWPDAMPIEYTIVNGVVSTRPCPPEDIILSNNQIDENRPVLSNIGAFTTIGEPGLTYTYSLVYPETYPDNAFFIIDSNVLRTNAVFNYEVDNSYTIKVRSSAGGYYIDRVFTILVTDVNDPPVLGVIGPKTVNEHALLNFTATASDEDLLPAPDTLTFSLAAGSSGAVPGGASIDPGSGVFNWTPSEAQGPGIYTFDVCVSDGMVSDCEPITVTVNEVNAPPIGADKTVSTDEDIDYVFLVSDFGFSDADDIPANELLGVKILSLPLDGELQLDGATVTAGDTIAADEIAAGLFVFVPGANEHDIPYASFQFKVQDDGGTDYGGVDTDLVTRYMTINVSSVNDAPAGTDKTVTILEDNIYLFNAADFGFSDVNDSPADEFMNVILVSTPASGALTFDGSPVTTGQVIAVEDLTVKDLVFTPAANANGSPYASFTFKVQDDGGTADGGVDTDPTANTVTINVTAVNDVPVGVDDEYIYSMSTRKWVDTDDDGNVDTALLSVPAPGVMENDSDVDGDTLEVSLKTGLSNTNGKLTLNIDGSFTFVPDLALDNYTDSFVYTLDDKNGGTVDVTVTLIINTVPPDVTLEWLEPPVNVEEFIEVYDDPLLLKVRLSTTDGVSQVEFRWWDTSDAGNLHWVIVNQQPVVEGQLEYSYTLDMTTLPYLPDIQVYAYALNELGNFKRIHFFIIHKPAMNYVYLPLITK